MNFTISGIKLRFPSAKQISTEELDEMIKQDPKPVIFDVREKQEREVSHIEGSIWIDSKADIKDQLEKALEEHPPGGSKLVAYCSVGYRSSQLITQSKRLEMLNLEGGLFKWTNEERSLMDCHGNSTQFTHPFNKLFGKLLNSSLHKYEA